VNVLGVNAYHGDVSAVLVADGDLVAAVEAARLACDHPSGKKP